MKTVLKIAGLALVGFWFSNCQSQKIIAPSDGTVQLASKTESLPLKYEQRDWYILFGLVPISHNMSDRIIRENNLKKVRIETVITPLDFIISIFTSIVTVNTRTQKIEGSTEQKK